MADQALGQELWTGEPSDKDPHILDFDGQFLSSSWDTAEPSFLSDQLSTRQISGDAESDCRVDSIDTCATQSNPSSTDGQVQPKSSSSPRKRTRRFPCDQCNELFTSQCDMRRHKSSIHDGLLKHLCPVQDCKRSRKGFSRKDNLMAHLRTLHKQYGDQSSPSNLSFESHSSPEMLNHDNLETQAHAQRGLESLSRTELVGIIDNEKERCHRLEAELQTLKERYETQQEVLMKVLSKSLLT